MTTTTTQAKHTINLDAPLLIPDNTPDGGWHLYPEDQPSNVVRSMFEWNPAKVCLHLSPSQQNGEDIEGTQLRKELEDELLFNANLLDYLLDHPDIIPEKWKEDEYGNTLYIFFRGTEYRDSEGDLVVRWLCWFDGRWRWGYGWLDGDWDDNGPAAVLAR